MSSLVGSWRQGRAGKQLVIEPKYKVRIERNVLIPMRDGTKLAADIFRPDSDGKFPVVMEYIPYRKDDGNLDLQRRLAEHGLAGVRLDVRGTGESEAVNTDEYMSQEQEDGYDAVEWLAKQPWANGNLGMIGISYGGFTCVQAAMHQPPHLKAMCPPMPPMIAIPTIVITPAAARCACITTSARTAETWRP